MSNDPLPPPPSPFFEERTAAANDVPVRLSNIMQSSSSTTTSSDATRRFSSTRRLQSFRCPGNNTRLVDGRSSPERSTGRVEVLLPTFEGIEVQSGEIAKSLLVSATGQCSTMTSSLPVEESDTVDDDTQGFVSNQPTGHVATSDVLAHSPTGNKSPHCFSWFSKSSLVKFVTSCISPVPEWSASGKRITVSKDVLSIYHESFLYGKVPLSTKVRTSLRGPFLGRILLVLECIAGLLLLALYVRTTYASNTPHWITVVQFSCSVFFLLDYLIKLYSAPVRLYYALSLNGIVDLISTLPIYFILSGVMEDAAIPQVFLVFRVLRAVPLLSSWALPGGAVGQEIFMMIAYCLGIFVLAAGVLQWVEWRATPKHVQESESCLSYGCLSFYDAFYFVIVTVFTVGYGDITLKTEWGRCVTILIILAAVVYIPVEINKILDLASRRPYGGKYAAQKVVGSRFIIVSGNLSYRAVEDFLSEIYHPSHAEDMRAFPLRMVIMAPFKPSFELKVLLTEYKGRVDFIEGTPLKDLDLARVSANIASAFFLMADHLAQDQVAEDAAQIMRTLSVHRFCGSKVRLIVEMLKPENQDNPIWDDVDGGIEIVCPEAIRYQLLARSCEVKGISTLVINLFKAGLKVRSPMRGHWMEKYSHGQQQEIYPVILPACFYQQGLTFEEVVEIVYTKFKIILFGLDIAIDVTNGTREVILFPHKRRVQPTDIGLVIAEDLAVAEKVSKYGKETLQAWYVKLYQRAFKAPYRRDGAMNNSSVTKRDEIHQLGKELTTLKSQYLSVRQGSGIMSSGHRVDLQMQLQEIVCASTNNAQEKLQAPHRGYEEPSGEVNKVYSLQEAVDLITQWPPSKPERPDYPVLVKRAESIKKNLEERTLPLVKLTKPHVLVCIQGKWPANLFCFVAHLRVPSLPNPPIVILHPHNPSIADWGCVGMFEEVYHVQGSPFYEIDLVRAGVLQAEKVVVLSPSGKSDGNKNITSEDKDIEIDIDNVLVTATIERLLHPVQPGRIIVELHQETEIHYLRPKLRINPHRFDPFLYNRNRTATFLYAPAFVEGKGFCSTSLTFLLYSLFFNRNTVTITEKLICGGNAEVVETADGEEVVGARLEQVPLPKPYEGKRFQELFLGMLRNQQWLVLGLYRTNTLTIPYVYTNPPPSEILLPGDLVYVLQ